jgi:hypothetical protein
VASMTSNEGKFQSSEETLVISVWREEEHSQSFRARLTWTSADAPEDVIKYAANPEAVLSDVSEWLSRLPNR